MNRLKRHEYETMVIMSLSTGYSKYLKEYLEKEEEKEKKHFYEILRVILINKIKSEKLKKPKEFVYTDEDIDYLKPLSGFDLTRQEANLTGKKDEYDRYYRLVSHQVKSIRKSVYNKLEEELQGKSITPRLILSSYKKVINK